MNACAEDGADGPARQPADAYRQSVRSLFRKLAEEAGAIDPDHLAEQLALLYDGATVAAAMDRNPGAGGAAREIAATLVDGATRRDSNGARRSKKAQPASGRRSRG